MRYAELAVGLRKQGVNVTPANPILVQWLHDGYTADQVYAALEIARQSKPAPASMPAKYLDTVLRNPQQPRKGGNLHEERAHTIAQLTGRAASREPIDITPA